MSRNGSETKLITWDRTDFHSQLMAGHTGESCDATKTPYLVSGSCMAKLIDLTNVFPAY